VGISIGFVPRSFTNSSAVTSCGLDSVVALLLGVNLRGAEYSAIEFALSRDGMAGVWGVCGDIGLPGEEDVDIEVAPTMAGTLDNCRLDEVDDRCKSVDEDIDSVRALLDSRIDWNFESWALVRLVEASPEGSKLCNVFLLSKSFKNSDILSSSVCKDPELAPASARIPEPGCTDEEKLCLPLLPWSSSTSLLAPPNEDLPRRWVKLLLYLLIGAGLGELEAEEMVVCSCAEGPPLSVAGIPAVRDDRFRA